MITVTIDAPAIYVVSLDDHPSVRGIWIHGSLVLNPPRRACEIVTVGSKGFHGCANANEPKELIVDVLEVATNTAITIDTVNAPNVHGTLIVDSLDKNVFLPIIQR